MWQTVRKVDFARLLLVPLLAVAVSCGKPKARKPLVKAEGGYDFTHGGDIDNQWWSGPKVGERIDLARLHDRYGKRFDSQGQQVSMVLLVDPECGACKAALDQIQAVHDRVTTAGIPYYVVSVNSSIAKQQLFTYIDSFDLDAPAYLWEKNEAEPPRMLYSMVLPSHLLLTADGTVVCKWPGTSASDYVRARMVNQIVSDAIQERDRRTTK